MKKTIFFLLPIIFWTASLSAAQKSGEDLVLENSRIKAVFNPEAGALVHLEDKNTGWVIMGQEDLAQSFELLLPMEGAEMTDEDKRYNVVKGVEQSDPVIEASADHITFTWSGLRTEFMKETADITFRGEVSLTDKGLEFTGHVENNSKYHIEYVSWPCLGEVSVPDKGQPLYHSTISDQRELFPHMFNQHGYWGVEYPTSTYTLPDKSFLQVNNSDRGFMVYNRTFPKNLTITSFELIPGYEIRGVNPYQDEIDGVKVRIQFKVNNCVYAMPGEAADLDPVQFVTYAGPWEEGVKIYAADRQAYDGKKADVADWMCRPMLWRKAGIGSGDDLVRYAEESRKAGVDVLLVGGAFRNSSGHVAEVPGLEDAIGKCHEMGLKVILETAWNQVDRRSPEYMQDFRGYVMADQFINLPYNYDWLCPSSPHVQSLVKQEWLSQPALAAADGYMDRDHNNTNHSLMCFDLDHGHRFGEPTVAGAVEMDCEMAGALASAPGKVAMGMGFSDYQNDYYDGYELNVSDGFFARHRVVSPEEPMVVKVDVNNARKMLNKSLLYRLIPAYDLNFYNDRLLDYKHIVEYGRDVRDFAAKYASRIWDASFSLHEGASVSGESLEWTVFKDRDGKRSVVIVNNGTGHSSEASVEIPGAGALVFAAVEDSRERPFTGKVMIEPQSALVVMEK